MSEKSDTPSIRECDHEDARTIEKEELPVAENGATVHMSEDGKPCIHRKEFHKLSCDNCESTFHEYVVVEKIYLTVDERVMQNDS